MVRAALVLRFTYLCLVTWSVVIPGSTCFFILTTIHIFQHLKAALIQSESINLRAVWLGSSEGYSFIHSSPSLVELTEDILKQLMELVFRLVCNGELSLARVLRKNILDKVEQKKQLRYTNSLKPLAARGVSARYTGGERVRVRVRGLGLGG